MAKDDFRIEVENDAVVLVLPRRMDVFVTPHQNAMRLGGVLEQAANDVPDRSSLLDPAGIARESSQIRLNRDKTERNVVLIFDWADRIRLSPGAAVIVARAIRQIAQDLDLLTRKVRMLYKNGRPVPQWSHERKSFPTT